MRTEIDGQAAELLAMAEASSRGCRVCIPFAGKAPYDFIIDWKGKLLRVQVKEIYLGKTDNGVRWMVDFMKPRGANPKRYKIEHYTERDCDLLVAACVKHRRVFVFPVSVIAAKRQASFYFDSTPSPLARNHLWVDSYENAWPCS